MAKYNGHPSYALWNVALWIANDEGLYLLALDCIRHTPNRKAAAAQFVETLRESGYAATPDGAKYSVYSVTHGMRGLDE